MQERGQGAEVIQDIIKGFRDYLVYLDSMGMDSLPCDTKGRREVIEAVPDSLKAIREEIGDCKRCRLHRSRKNIVFGYGNEDADLVFVGEGPGREEDIQGLPFVGEAGAMLTRIIERVFHLRREDVYIANVVKCRPPDNRTPQADEIATCLPFLEKQLSVIKPEVIVALGGVAARSLIHTDKGITSLRGKFYNYRDGSVIMPTFHPAFLLRNPNRKRETYEDMLKVKERLNIP